MDRKEWIKPYRDAIDKQFKLTDDAQQDVDAYFARLEQYANGFSDQGEFATKFMQDPMYQEYLGLFTKYQKMVVTSTGETAEEATKTMKNEAKVSAVKEHFRSTAERESKIALSQALPDEVNRVRWGGARTLPVIGPIVQWFDNFQWFRRLFGHKKDSDS